MAQKKKQTATNRLKRVLARYEADDALRQALAAWTRDVEKLQSDISKWLLCGHFLGRLTPITDEETWERCSEPVVCHEGLFHYTLPQWGYRVCNGPEIWVEPRGMNVVGVAIRDPETGQILLGSGRVDVVKRGARQSFSVYRGTDGIWYLPTPEAASPWARLDKEAFYDRLATLLES